MSKIAAQNLGARRPDRIRTGVLQALWITMAGAAVVGGVVGMAAYFLHVNGSLYVVLGALLVLRGALQGLGHTAARP